MIRFNKAFLEKLRQFGIETKHMPVVEDCLSHIPMKDMTKSSRRSSKWFGLDDITPIPGFHIKRDSSMKNLWGKEIHSSSKQHSELEKNTPSPNQKCRSSKSCSSSKSSCSQETP